MSEFIPLLVNGGTAGAVFLLFLLGQIYPKSTIEEKNREIAELKRALELERERSDAGMLAGHLVKDILEGITRAKAIGD